MHAHWQLVVVVLVLALKKNYGQPDKPHQLSANSMDHAVLDELTRNPLLRSGWTTFVFGYGSLMCDESRARKIGVCDAARAVLRPEAGCTRRWNTLHNGGAIIGLERKMPGEHVAGVLFGVSDAQLAVLDEYEHMFTRVRVPNSMFDSRELGVVLHVAEGFVVDVYTYVQTRPVDCADLHTHRIYMLDCLKGSLDYNVTIPPIPPYLNDDQNRAPNPQSGLQIAVQTRQSAPRSVLAMPEEDRWGDDDEWAQEELAVEPAFVVSEVGEMDAMVGVAMDAMAVAYNPEARMNLNLNEFELARSGEHWRRPPSWMRRTGMHLATGLTPAREVALRNCFAPVARAPNAL